MADRILRSILTVVIAVLLVSLLVITGLLYSDFTFVHHMYLRDGLSLAVAAVEKLGDEYLAELPSDRYRITRISADGRVLFDSVADAESMENHADREEIVEALEDGIGSSSRYSVTLTEKTIYESVRLSDGSVLRISVASETAASMVLDLLQPMMLIAVLALLLSLWLARRMTRQIIAPLNRLDLDKPLSNDTYEELKPLLARIGSQHKEIEDQIELLRRRQREFDLITSNMREALILLDADSKIVSINPAGRALLRGRDDGACSIENIDRLPDAVDEARKNGRSEFTSPSEDGGYCFNISCIGEGTALLGIVILAYDVTAQLNAERMQRDFTSNVSHELKTPLQSIIGSAELIENGIVKPEDMPRFVGHIRKEASRLVTLIEDIIRLAQLDEGMDAPRERVSLLELAEDVRETLAYAAEERSVEVTVTGDEGVVEGVQTLLFEMIYNLTDNAIRYNVDGGSVNIDVRDDGETVKLSVTDSGIGIAPEHHDKLFERFYRVDKSHSRSTGGTGLGLSIVKHAVKYHRGSVTLESEVGRGTTVTAVIMK